MLLKKLYTCRPAAAADGKLERVDVSEKIC